MKKISQSRILLPHSSFTFSSLLTVSIASRTVVGRVLVPDLGRRSQNARSEFREKVLYVFAVQSSSTLNLGTKISMQ
ncbi:hypothetical protein V6N11_052612 [Hibiscus sabdariffa]|uniref:Secreted protein n=1 Tax=Hibiscus sabdariffa TaxID=183260 RepID=A0ABR2UAW0_9ROSI